MTELTPCPSCASHKTRKVGPISGAYLFASHNLDEILDGGSLYACSTCHLNFRFPLPSRDKLNELYRTSSIDHWQYEEAKRFDWSTTKKWLDKLHDGGSLLDVGCYDGAFSEVLDDRWQMAGIEINEEAIQIASKRGVQIVAEDLSDLTSVHADAGSSQYDATVAFDVIEHVPDPQKLLKDMMQVTRPGGTLIIATGNRDALSWKLMGSSYWYCTIPEHLAFISTSWCKTVAQTLNLELIHLETYCHEQNRTLKLTLKELTSNLLYRFSPSLFARLRRAGFGDKDTDTFDELAYYPPTWTTAKDHLIAIFRKG